MVRPNNKSVFTNYKKTLSFTLNVSAFLSLLLIGLYALFASINYSINLNNLSFMGSLLFFLFCVLTIGILVPFLFSFVNCNGILISNEDVNVKFSSFLKTSMLGFNKAYRGKLKIASNLMWAVLIFLCLDSITVGIGTSILYSTNESYKTIIDTVNQMLVDNNSLEQVLSYLRNTNLEDINRVLFFYTNFISIFPAVGFFIIRILRNFMKFLFVGRFLNINPRLFESLYTMMSRKNKRIINYEYNKVMWIFYLSIGIGFITPYLLMYFLGQGINLDLISLTSVFFSLFITIPLMPIIFNTQFFIAENYLLSTRMQVILYERVQSELDMIESTIIEKINSTPDPNLADLQKQQLEQTKNQFKQQAEQIQSEMNKIRTNDKLIEFVLSKEKDVPSEEDTSNDSNE